LFLLPPSGETNKRQQMSLLLTKFLQILLFLMGFLPLRVISWAAACIGASKVLNQSSAFLITTANLRLVFPGLEKKAIKELAISSIKETLKTVFEMGFVWSFLPRKDLSKYVSAQGFEKIKKSLDYNKGLILFAPHLSNIEIILNYMGRQVPSMALYTPSKNKHIDKVMLSARTRMGVTMVEPNLSGIKSILENLNKGGVVIIASDQVPKLEGGMLSNFFLIPALTMTLVSKLKMKSKAPCHSVFCIRVPNGKGFKVRFSEEIAGMDLDLQSSVDRMNEELEKCIMNSPEQYSWEYKRYKHLIYTFY
jgi:KDO2-lipid IV(A) lauroyltransferase